MDEIKDSDIFGDYDEWGGTYGSDYYIDEEWIDRMVEEHYQYEWNRKRNIQRDKRGRLNKGALLAKKDICSEEMILQRYIKGKQVKEIVEDLGCSKTTVYRVLKKHGYGR